MKKNALLAGIILAGIVAGCSKLKSLTNITVNVPYTQSFTIPYIDSNIAVPRSGIPVPTPWVAVPTNSNNILMSNNTSSDKVNSLILKSLTMQVTTPANGNFNFLDSAQVFISSDTSKDSALLAYDYHIPRNVSSISFTCTGSDMKSYFLKDTMYIKLHINADSTTKEQMNMNVNTDFTLSANPLN